MPQPNYDKLAQSLFFHFDPLREEMDLVRELLRKVYPVGSVLRAFPSNDSPQKVLLTVTGVSYEGHDLDKLVEIDVTYDGLPHTISHGHRWHEIEVVSRPPVPEPPQPPVDPGEGWYLLPNEEPLQPGDGFLHPDHPGVWIDYECRPDYFRGGPKFERAHKWPWRRRKP